MNNRWWTYQKERFPLLLHAPMVALFCLSVLLFSALQQPAFEMPDTLRLAGAFFSALIVFFQLRVADEFKDFETDLEYRPHRAVPRGLISLRSLGVAAWTGAALQFAIAIYIDVGLVPILLLVWAWLGLMTREFFVGEWLRAHPLAYLVSHMVIMPLIAFYVSAFDWLCDCRAMPGGLPWILAASFFLGLVLELGRKIRIPERERRGVETYSAAWGTRVALAGWAAAVIGAVAAGAVAVHFVSGTALFAPIAAGSLGVAALIAYAFPLGDERRLRGVADKAIEPGSGLIVLLLYLGLGPLQALTA